MDFPNVALSSWTLVITTFSLCIVLLFRHYTKRERCGIRGPSPVPFFGNLMTVRKHGFEKTHELWMKTYGNIYGYYMGYKLNISIADPEVLKTILVKEFASFTDRAQFGNNPQLIQNGLFFLRGGHWKRTRNLLTPTFSAGKLKHMMAIINTCADVLGENLKKKVGNTVTTKSFFGQFTADTIASTAFGIEINSQETPDEPFVRHLSTLFNFGRSPVARISGLIQGLLPFMGPLLYKLGYTIWDKESVAFYEHIGKALIKDRMENPNERADFLNLMVKGDFGSIKGQYMQNGATIDDSDKSTISKDENNRLTLDEMNGTVFTFFLAGYETTATMLHFASYRLALHPEIDSKIYEEIKEYIGQEAPTYESLGKLGYLDQFMQEVLRFYPPVSRINRMASRDVKVGDILIPAGSVVNIPTWYIHHSEQFYPDPEKFDPNRFAAPFKGLSDTPTYLPFGFGPRHCIGMRLAIMEAKLALVHVLRKVRFVKTEKTQVPLEIAHFGIMRPKQPESMQVAIEERQKTVS